MNRKLEFVFFLSERFMNYQVFDLSNSFTARSDDNLGVCGGVGITVSSTPAFSSLRRRGIGAVGAVRTADI